MPNRVARLSRVVARRSRSAPEIRTRRFDSPFIFVIFGALCRVLYRFLARRIQKNNVHFPNVHRSLVKCLSVEALKPFTEYLNVYVFKIVKRFFVFICFFFFINPSLQKKKIDR